MRTKLRYIVDLDVELTETLDKYPLRGLRDNCKSLSGYPHALRVTIPDDISLKKRHWTKQFEMAVGTDLPQIKDLAPMPFVNIDGVMCQDTSLITHPMRQWPDILAKRDIMLTPLNHYISDKEAYLAERRRNKPKENPSRKISLTLNELHLLVIPKELDMLRDTLTHVHDEQTARRYIASCTDVARKYPLDVRHVMDEVLLAADALLNYYEP